ncbi:hypothetical protein RSAG8_01261, partial [Rhizoctonia solani AG-8 WAC10335]
MLGMVQGMQSTHIYNLCFRLVHGQNYRLAFAAVRMVLCQPSIY